MGSISVEYDGSVAVVKLSRGVTNALDRELAEELGQTLGALREDARVRALVLASGNDQFFSIGLDLPQLFPLDRRAFSDFIHLFGRVCLDLYALRKPTIAAITGHAIAGGCILALCCDYRFIALGKRRIGLNEIRLGIPVPYLADCVLRSLVGGRFARDMVDSGSFYLPDEALQMGLVDQVLPVEEVLPACLKRARVLGAHAQQAFAEMKRRRVESVMADALAHQDEEERMLVEMWYSDDARKRLAEAMQRF
jgi:enoyl-CoA hydratase/carnithine racemase